MFQQRRSRIALTVVCALILTIVLAVPAFADISSLPPDPPGLGVSPTNPSAYNDPEGWWRQGWGNTLPAKYLLNLPSDTIAEYADGDDERVLGAIYLLDQDVFTDIDENTPQLYPHATGVWEGSKLVLFADPLSTSTGYSLLPGARYVYEAPWYLHYNFYSESRVSSRTITVPCFIDVTTPSPVRKVVARPREDYSGPTDIWFESNRVHLTWEDMEYDAFSGVANYEISVNGQIYDERVHHLGHTTTSITIDDLPGGVNELKIIPIDRATNRGPAETIVFRSDPDIPEVEVTSPATDGQWMTAKPTFSANASDSAGVQWVDFKIDGKSVYTDKTAPYTFTKDMSAYAWGSTYTLTATAKDMYGHTASDSKTFRLDNTIPRISSISDSPDPFYPIIREGYKDNTTIQFFTSEGGVLVLYVYDSDGALYTKRSKRNIGSGWQSIVWDGLGGEGGSAEVGTFKYRVMVKDAAGNQGYSAYGYTTIRDYEIVRISPDAVRIVPR